MVRNANDTQRTQALPEWPVAIIEVYMHDALGGRHWASHSACKLFVDNLRTAWSPPPPPPLPAPSDAPPRALTAGGGDAELSSGKKEESDLKGKSVAEAEGVMVAPSTTAKIIAAGLHPSSGAAGGGGGSDVGDDSSSSDGEMIVEEGGHVETVLPATSVGGGREAAAAVAAAATAAARALARRREQETSMFSGFEKISLDGADENIPAVSDRFARWAYANVLICVAPIFCLMLYDVVGRRVSHDSWHAVSPWSDASRS